MKQDCLTLSADGSNIIKWSIDAAFVVHPDFKSHSGGTMTMGKGAAQSGSKKQKVNMRSSTEAELVGSDDMIGQILWTNLFLDAQGYKVKDTIVYRDNQSAMKLETNGKASSGKCMRHLNIRYFFLTDQIEQGKVSIKYCPTDAMTSDYMTTVLAKLGRFMISLRN